MKRKKRRYPIIYIKTNRNGWTKVRLIERKPSNTILILMPDGQIINRKAKKVRWGNTRIV